MRAAEGSRRERGLSPIGQPEQKIRKLGGLRNWSMEISWRIIRDAVLFSDECLAFLALLLCEHLFMLANLRPRVLCSQVSEHMHMYAPFDAIASTVANLRALYVCSHNSSFYDKLVVICGFARYHVRYFVSRWYYARKFASTGGVLAKSWSQTEAFSVVCISINFLIDH